MFILLRVVETIVNILPYNLVIGIGRGIGLFGYYLSKRHRKLAVSNIVKALDKTLPEAKQIAKGSFKNIGINTIEFLGDHDTPVEITGYEHVDQQNGNIFVLGHFGNWEILGRIGSKHGLIIAVIGRGINEKGLNQFVRSKRAFAGLEMFEKKGSFKHLSSFLRQKKSVGLLIDQYAGKDGVFVDFCGIPTSTTPSPVLLALRTGCGIVPVFILRINGKYEIIIEPPIKTIKTGNILDDIQVNTQAMIKPLEKYVRMYPEQWWWVHRRWR